MIFIKNTYTFRRRTVVRIVTFACGAAIILTGLILAGRRLSFENRRLTHTSYLRQTEELANGIEHIGEEFEKMTFASSRDTRTDSAFVIWQLCGRSAENMTNLPLSEYNTEELMAYFNKSGEYARYVCQKDSLDNTDIETLDALCDYSAALAEQVYTLSGKLHDGKSGYSDANVPQLKKTAFMGFNMKLDDAAKELASITENYEYPEIDYSGRHGDIDNITVNADEFDIEKILSALPDNVHIIKWELGTLDKTPCACVDVETASQNIYRIYFALNGKELKIERKS